MNEVLETPVVEESTPTPIETAPVEIPELSYEYQPTDESGRPLGGKQVFKHRTPDELTERLVEQNTLLIRKLREEKKMNRLGIQDVEDIPAEAPRFGGLTDFEPRQLSADERLQLSRDLLDPERFNEAKELLFEASLGAKPEALRNTLVRMQETNQRLLAKAEADAFVQNTPSYYRCKENFETITNWMVKNDLAPVRENFQRAYDVMSAAGLLVEPMAQPVATPVPVPVVAPVAAEPVIEPVVEPPPPPRVAAIPSGLTRNHADDAGLPRSPGEDIVYELIVRGQKKTFHGMAAIDVMPGDEYKRRMRDPAFAKKVEQLMAQANK